MVHPRLTRGGLDLPARHDGGDVDNLSIYPVPSRVTPENSTGTRSKARRGGDAQHSAYGLETRFESCAEDPHRDMHQRAMGSSGSCFGNEEPPLPSPLSPALG